MTAGPASRQLPDDPDALPDEAETTSLDILGRGGAESAWPGDRRRRARLIGRILGRRSAAAGDFAVELAARPGLLDFLDGLALCRGVDEGRAADGGPDRGAQSLGHRNLGHRDLGHRDLGHRDLGHRDLGRRDRRRILKSLDRAGLLVRPVSIRELAAEPPAPRPIPGARRRVELPRDGRDMDPVERVTDWLRRAFSGEPFPTDDPVGARPDATARLDTGARRDLWDYLRAVAVDDPDRAAAVLLRRLERPGWRGSGRGRSGRGAEAAEKELRIRFRQAAPFRDGAWTESGQTLAEHVALHLLWVRRCGFRLDAPSEAFFRGFLALTRTLLLEGGTDDGDGPTLDPWSEGLERLGWATAFAQSRETWEAMRSGRLVEGQVSALLGLPQRLQAWLAARAGETEP